MKPIQKLIALSFASSIAFAGCATSKPALEGQLDPDFGSAIRANIAAQAVSPSATQKANTFIPADPARTSAARKNYRDNTVPEPERVNQGNE